MKYGDKYVLKYVKYATAFGYAEYVNKEKCKICTM
jgi:hypothetical protein